MTTSEDSTKKDESVEIKYITLHQLEDASPPCHDDLKSMQRLRLSDLKLGWNQHSAQFILVVVCEATKFHDQHCALVYDGNTYGLMKWYVTNESCPLKVGDRMAVKQPYVEIMSDVPMLRVDHPCDIVRLNTLNEIPSNIDGPLPSIPTDLQKKICLKDHVPADMGMEWEKLEPLPAILGKCYHDQSLQQKLKYRGRLDTNIRLPELLRYEAEHDGVSGKQRDKHENPEASELFKVIPVKGRGLGVVASKNIDRSTTIFKEKPFAYCKKWYREASYPVILNQKHQTVLCGSQVTLFEKVLHRLERDPESRESFCGLFAPSYANTKRTIELVDGQPIIDVFHIQEIIALNSFTCRASGEPVHDDPSTSPSHIIDATARHPTGLWPQVARLNHDCSPNAACSFDGYFMKVYTTRDIDEGEEITFSYCNADLEFSARQSKLFNTWKFICTCQRCAREKDALRAVQSRSE